MSKLECFNPFSNLRFGWFQSPSFHTTAFMANKMLDTFMLDIMDFRRVESKALLNVQMNSQHVTVVGGNNFGYV